MGWLLLIAASACSGKERAAVTAENGAAGSPAQLKADPIEQITARRIDAVVATPDPDAAYWNDVPRGSVALLAQPMIAPRPDVTTTEFVVVQAVHDGTHIAFRLQWIDSEKSEAGVLGTFSDAFAIQFPMKEGVKTPVMMGAKDLPVHIYHWRAQYQRDKESGKPTMSQCYPNLCVDMYPMEFKYAKSGTAEQKEAFSPGKVEGNPQAYEKTAVDEIVAEGFSTSQVQEGHGGLARGVWKDGRWTLVMTRPLTVENGSLLRPGGDHEVAFAAWQGGKGEVGSRKSVLMAWLPLKVQL
jgi:hypothetical protein